MCGRFSQSRPASVYARYVGIEHEIGDREGRFNLAPSQEMAVVTRRGERKDLDWCVWGFVPHWARDPQALKTRPVNARIETVADKPMFRDAWRRGQRGMVPADGFYEWRVENGKKQPYFIRRRDGEPLLLAALWDTWGADGSLSCTVLVGPPNKLVALLHDRMPVIIPRSEVDHWLDPRLPADTVRNLIPPCPGDELEVYAVSTRVNKAENDGPDCIAPIPAPDGR